MVGIKQEGESKPLVVKVESVGDNVLSQIPQQTNDNSSNSFDSISSVNSVKLEICLPEMSPSNSDNDIKEIEDILKHKFGGKKRCDFDVRWSMCEGITKVNVKTALEHKKALKNYLLKLKPGSLKCMINKYSEMSHLLFEDVENDYQSMY